MSAPITIRFYGRLAEAIAPAIAVDGECSVAQLRERLARDHPHVAATLASRYSRACVGDRLVRDDFVVRAGAEIEFLPPVSGG
ncbi:MAG: MoaD/ThiS family protein [Sphingomicrobium sp.]